MAQQQQRIFSAADSTRLAQGLGISLLGRSVGRAADIANQALLARMLGPGSYGLYAIGWTILRLLSVVALLGLERGLIRYGAQHHDNQARQRQVIAQSLLLALLSGAVVGAGLFVAAPWMAYSLFEKPALQPVIRWFAVACVLVCGLRVAAAAARLARRIDYSVYAEDLCQPIAGVLLLLIFYAVGWRLLGGVLASTLSFAVALLLALFYIHRLYPGLDLFRPGPRSLAGQLLLFSMPTAAAGIFSTAVVWVDRIFVGSYRPASEAGIYQAIAQFPLAFAIIMGAFNAVLSPLVAELSRGQEWERLREVYRVSTKWGLYVSLPLFLVISSAPAELIGVVFGQEYVPGAPALLILTLAQLVNVATGGVGLILTMTNYQRSWMVLTGLALSTSLALNWLLTPVWGLLGAAVATALSTCLLFTLGLLTLRRVLQLWPYDRRYLKGLVAAVLSFGVLLLTRQAWPGPPALLVPALLVLSPLAFGLALIMAGLEAEDRVFLAAVRRRVGLD